MTNKTNISGTVNGMTYSQRSWLASDMQDAMHYLLAALKDESSAFAGSRFCNDIRERLEHFANGCNKAETALGWAWSYLPHNQVDVPPCVRKREQPITSMAAMEAIAKEYLRVIRGFCRRFGVSPYYGLTREALAVECDGADWMR